MLDTIALHVWNLHLIVDLIIIMISGMIINTLNTIKAKQIKLVQNFARWKQREQSL